MGSWGGERGRGGNPGTVAARGSLWRSWASRPWGVQEPAEHPPLGVGASPPEPTAVP